MIARCLGRFRRLDLDHVPRTGTGGRTLADLARMSRRAEERLEAAHCGRGGQRHTSLVWDSLPGGRPGVRMGRWTGIRRDSSKADAPIELTISSATQRDDDVVVRIAKW